MAAPSATEHRTPLDGSLKATISRLKAPAPLQGRHAREVSRSQGLVWHGIVSDREILEAVAVRRRLDERGDALLVSLVDGLGRLAGTLKRERQYEAHSLAADLTAVALLIAELDDAEDTHDDRIEREAGGSLTALGLANAIHGLLLGQTEAACDLDAPHPLALCSPGGEP